MASNLESFTDILGDEIGDSQPFSSPNYSGIGHNEINLEQQNSATNLVARPAKGTGQYGQFRSVEEIDPRYRNVFAYPFFNLVQSRVIEDALYSDNSIVVCAPTGSGKTVVFEMAIVQLLMEINDTKYTGDFKIIYMAPVKALCTERLTEWYSKFTKLGLLCIEVTGDTDVDFSQLKPYRVIITTPEKWDMLTRRWRDHKGLVEVIKLFLIDEVHILNDVTRGPVLEAVVSRMKTIESSAQSAHRIELLQKQYRGGDFSSSVDCPPPRIRFVAVSATVSNPEDVALWLGSTDKPAVYHKFGDECRPVKLKRIVEGYPCAKGSSIFKFDIILNYKLWPIIQKYHDGKPTLIFCNTRKSVALTAETLSRELTITFSPEQKAKLAALAATIKNKKLQALVLSGVGCHHAGLLYEERLNIERAFRNRDLPILITTTTLAMGVNLPAHLVIVKNTQQYVNGTYQEYSISTVLQMVGRAGRPQFDTEATAVIMTRIEDKQRYQSLVGGCEPLQSYLHKRLPENLNSEAALGTVGDVAQCVQWLRSTFLFVRAARDPKRYLGLHPHAPQQLISKKIEELCVKAMNGLASSGLISMDEASCIASTDAGRLMSIFYLDLETMKHIMTIDGTESLERLLWIVCESHELEDMHLRVDERRCLNALNRNNAAATIRFPMKGKINTRQMKLNCIIQAVLGCLQIPDPALNQEAMKIMRIADRICKCMVAYVTRPDLTCQKPQYFSAVFNALTLAKCVAAHLWENSQYVSKQLKGIGPTFSMLLATAGKVNFRLLEESNPRDLERIMNKGAPAGNMIRKQISFLPKYQLSVKPIDENTVKIQLMLLNHNYLAENIEQLTAGDAHKSFIIVGGSDNNLLLFTSIKDRDLISVYDGCLSYEVTRQQRSEYKIHAHCISSTYVGIDDSYEYVFQNLEPHIAQISHIREEVPSKRITKKQTSITDTFKERKRKNSVDDITQSKEKKKRENALIERFKYLKDSFGIASKQLKENVKESAHMSNEIIDDVTKSPKYIPYKVTEILSNEKYNNVSSSTSNTDNVQVQVDDHANHINVEDMDSDSFLDDEKINCIISDIENEISKGSIKSDTASVAPAGKHLNQRKTLVNNDTNKSVSLKRLTEKRQRPPSTVKSNYNFIDLLEKNMDLSEDEESEKFKPDNHTGFSDAIKEHIGKYLQNAKKTADTPDLSISTMLRVDASPIGDIVPPKEVTTKIDDNDDADLKNPKSNDIQRRKFNDVVYDNFAQHQDEEIANKSGLVLNDYMHNSVNKYKTVNKETDKESNIQNIKELAVNHMDDFPLTGNKNEKCYHFIDTNKSNSPNKIIENHNINSLTSILNTTEQPKMTKKVDHTIGQSFGSITKTGLDPYISLKRSNESSQRINKYSYTATKIDVFTKDMPEHRVRVVRKLKLDLGVTEIVTEEKIYNSHTAPDVLNEETNNYSNLCIEDFIEDFTQQNTKMIPIRAITKSPIESPHDLQNENTMMGKKYVNLNRSTIIPSLVLKNDKTPEIAQTVAIKDVSEYVKTTETQYQPPSKENVEKTQVTSTFSNRNGKINGSETNTESNIEDILQKYKQIFSTTNKEEIVDFPVINKNNSNKISNLKPKRPFKIRDLPNVKSPMHKISIDKEPIANLFPVQILRENNKELEVHSPVLDEAPLIRTKAPAELLEYTGHNILDTGEDQLNETDPVISEAFDIEVSDNCPNIDSSMFDPKALLQCMNKERSEVVSPPPEFGDTSPCYSPELDSVLKSDGESIYYKNIFEDYAQNIHLTPSREIETWTLSREDENLYIEPTSYTVFRTNSPLIKESNNFNENIHGNSVPRNPSLSQFKFHKDKLNI